MLTDGEKKLATLLENFTDTDDYTDARLEWIAVHGLLLQAAGKSQDTFNARPLTIFQSWGGLQW